MVLTFILCGFFFTGVFGQCSLPSMLQNTVWIDSNKGELVFDTTNMTGWDLDYDGNTEDPLTHWQCFFTEAEGSKLYLVFQLSQTIVILQDEFNVFMCMELTQVTDYSFYYYLLWSDAPPVFNYDRISGQDVNTTITDPRSQVCLDANNPLHAAAYPNIAEYHVLLKQGSVAEATQECPDSYFGVYTYTITDIDNNVVSCGNTSDRLDVCTDYTTMAFNNSLCNTSIAYTENGSLACLMSFTSGGYIYHTVYNHDDTVDEISTFRFTCFVSSLASDGSLQVSQTMGSCKKGQTPDSQPVFSNGTVAGLNIQFAPNRLCPKTDEENEDSGLSTGAIIGITFGVILFIVAIIVLVCICIRCRQPSKEKEKEEIEKKSGVRSPREEPPDISTMMHQPSQLWINGFPGEPPNDTKYCGDSKVIKSPDDKFNPFSVPPLTNGKFYEGGAVTPTLTAQSKLAQNHTETSVASMPIDVDQSNSTKVLSRPAQNLKPDERTVIPQKDETGESRIMQDNLSTTSEQKVSSSEPLTKYSTSRNANISAMSIQHPENCDQDNTNHNNNRQLVEKEQSTISTSEKTFERKKHDVSNDDGKQILTHAHVVHTSQDNEGQILEQNIYATTVDKVAPNAHTVFSNDTGKQTLTSLSSSAHNVHDSRGTIVMTPVAIHTDPSITETNNGPQKETRRNTTNLHERSQSEQVCEQIQSKQNRKTIISVQAPSKLENNPPKCNNKTSFSKKNKSNNYQNRKKSKGQLATNPKRRGHDALVGSKSVSIHRRPNKRGIFYNDETKGTTEQTSYTHLTDLNETVYSDTGIYYDDDNERERAMIKPKESEQRRPTQLQYGLNENFSSETPTENLRASVNSDLSLSRISHITIASSRRTCSPTSHIDNRGVKYFIDNETNSIVISVKSADIPEENTGDRDNKDILTEDGEDDLEYEEEEVEEFDGNTEVVNKLEDVDTVMKVQYGGDEEDPDRMILGSYGPDLLTIKE